MSLPCGIRNYNYAQDMAIFRTKTHWVLLVCFLLALFILPPLFFNRLWLNTINLIGITTIAALGLNILVGYCGQLSIGHAGFIAVGAYTSAILTNRFDLPFIVGLISAGLVAGMVGIVFGLPSIRVKGFYLAITTIAAQYIIMWIISHWELTGGFNGISVPYASLGGLVFDSPVKQFFLVMVVVCLAVFFAINLTRTKVGRAFIAIRDNDLAAEVMGVNVQSYKLIAFFIGCFFAGIAGSLLAHTNYSVTPEQFSFSESILYVGMIIVGGLGTTIGSIFGVAVFRILQKVLLPIYLVPFLERTFTNMPAGFASGLAPMIFGLIIILFLILEPRGLAHRWTLFKASYRIWPFSY
jgi:branched-chain amino acid transport system permease protein